MSSARHESSERNRTESRGASATREERHPAPNRHNRNLGGRAAAPNETGAANKAPQSGPTRSSPPASGADPTDSPASRTCSVDPISFSLKLTKELTFQKNEI